MAALWKGFAPVFLLLIAFALIEGGLTTDYADARSKVGGKSFSSSPSKAKTPAATGAPAAAGSSMSRGLMGGLLGGAMGAMLFGSIQAIKSFRRRVNSAALILCVGNLRDLVLGLFTE